MRGGLGLQEKSLECVWLRDGGQVKLPFHPINKAIEDSATSVLTPVSVLRSECEAGSSCRASVSCSQAGVFPVLY